MENVLHKIRSKMCLNVIPITLPLPLKADGDCVFTPVCLSIYLPVCEQDISFGMETDSDETWKDWLCDNDESI